MRRPPILMAWSAGFFPRGRKVVRDLWGNKTRTFLVVLSIAVGVFAVGSIVHMNAIVSQDLADSYASVNPADATIYVSGEPFDNELVKVVSRMEGVQAAEGRRRLVVHFRTAPGGPSFPLLLFVIPDYAHMEIDKVEQEKIFGPDPEKWRGGAWPPPDRQIVLERSSLLMPGMGLGNTRLGDTLLIEMPEGKQRQIRIAGLAYDMGNYPATFSGMAFGYVTFDTFEWLGQAPVMNELSIRVAEDLRNEQSIKRIADAVKDKVEKSGHAVFNIAVHQPGKLPLDYVYQAITLLLAALGTLALFLSTLLVINTISAQVSQQLRQIGIMKTIGARTDQLVTLYLGMVALYGTLALLVAVPLGVYAAEWFVNFLSYFLNFELKAFHVPLQVLAFEAAVGLGVPLLAALFPVLVGTRITVREALNSYGIVEKTKAPGGPRAAAFHWMPGALRPGRPLLLSLRNTFRRRARLALTLLTLVLAGTIFISVMNVRASLTKTLDSALGYFNSDLWVVLRYSYPLERVEAEVLSVPGVVKAEGWGGASAFRVRPDGTESSSLYIHAPQTSSKMIQPIVVEGRWLLPEDENAVVISTELLRAEPDLQVGDEVVFKLGGRKTSWRVVGVVRTALLGQVAYVNYPYFARVARDVGNASVVFAVLDRHDSATQAGMSKALDTHLSDRRIQVSQIQTTTQVNERVGTLFAILLALLLTMTVLMAAVGGLGLMGTMGLNVLERTREIGVMRAIGAPDGAIMRMVMIEAILIGVISWAFGAVLALPLGKWLGDAVGISLLQTPLDYTYSVEGALLWLVLVVLIAGMASLLPARSATRLTVREVLAYE